MARFTRAGGVVAACSWDFSGGMLYRPGASQSEKRWPF